jgi:outer membrane murein-binding lipoprotein Lpp
MARPQVNIRLSEDEKERWEQAVEEQPQWNSRADLVRTAVAHELSDEYGLLARAEGGGGGTNEAEINELVETVGSMQNRMDALESTIRNATEAIHTAPTSDDRAGDVFDTLPSNRNKAVDASDVADELKISESVARVALEDLHESTSVVEKTPDPEIGWDNPRWWRSQ